MPNDNQPRAFVYVGAYTGFPPNPRGKAEGIDVFRLTSAGGALAHAATMPRVENPTFLAVDRSQRFLYAANGSPTTDGQPGGAISAFAVDPRSGHLSFINRQITVGQGPSHVAVDRERWYVFGAGYHAGNVSVFRVREDGGLGPATDLVQHVGHSVDPDRQTAPHPHSVNLDPAERFVLVPDLGLDKVYVYRFDRAAGKLLPNDPPFATSPPGFGPRHLAFHPNGRYVFVINEMGSSLTSFRYDPDGGMLTTIETVPTIPADFAGQGTAADVHVTPSGRFVYGSNRGHDSIVTFQFDEAAARLSLVGFQSTGGHTPRNFALDATGTLLLAANQNSDNLVAFRVDPTTGKLASTGNEASTPSPTCVKIVEA